MGNFIAWLQANFSFGDYALAIFGFFLFFSIFFEVIPIKFSPLTWLFSKIGKMAGKELAGKVDNLEGKVDNLEDQIVKVQYCNSKKNATDCRIRILHFADESRQGQRHSKESYIQVLEDIDTYQKYCQNHPEFKNNRTVLANKKIMEDYEKATNSNDFL